MALACGKEHITLPHVIQELKTNMGFLPALWADDGDAVMVDDVLFALKALSKSGCRHADVLFVSPCDAGKLVFTGVEPWGWDKVVRRQLLDAGVVGDVMPDSDSLDTLRRLSDRRQAVGLLAMLRDGIADATCGESRCCTDVGEISRLLSADAQIVLKAPWSSSGRGVRYANARHREPLEAWARKVVERQGGVMVEPYYRKVKDFAMEFRADGSGNVEYCGLSVFETNNTSYVGNVVATEEEKERMVSRYIPMVLLDEVRLRLERCFRQTEYKAYRGMLGVDMMVVSRAGSDGFLLHPCVEVNLRRTMGHVANSIMATPADPVRLMRIVHDVNFRLKIDALENCFVKVY